MNKELKAFRKICRCLSSSYEFTDEFKKNKKLVETALVNYEELKSIPVVLYGRTHGYTQTFIDIIRKNYKEIKITNLEDENKLYALEIIKKKLVNMFYVANTDSKEEYNDLVVGHYRELTQEEYDLLKEIIK